MKKELAHFLVDGNYGWDQEQFTEWRMKHRVMAVWTPENTFSRAAKAASAWAKVLAAFSSSTCSSIFAPRNSRSGRT